MTARLIDGAAVAARIRAEVAEKVEAMQVAYRVRPGLATVLVGDDTASQSYVRMKHKACQELGIASFQHDLPADASQEQVEGLVRDLNAD